MKKLNRLIINAEKALKNEELLTLRGGYGTGCCTCHAWDGTVIGHVISTPTYCNTDCFEAMQTGYGTWDCLV